jgi:hypothetical protein
MRICGRLGVSWMEYRRHEEYEMTVMVISNPSQLPSAAVERYSDDDRAEARSIASISNGRLLAISAGADLPLLAASGLRADSLTRTVAALCA